MPALRLSPAVAAAFPGTLIALVTATGLRGHEPWPHTAAALEELEQRLADGSWRPADETDPRIEAWHTAYRSFGTNPRRIRPSVDALGRRMAKKGTLPRINPAVDSYNAVSVRHGLPAGAFDLDRVTGDIDIRPADGTESFTPLGEPGTVEHPRPGEIIYADTTGSPDPPLEPPRRPPHPASPRTPPRSPSSWRPCTPTATADLLKVAAEELQGLLAPHAARTAVRHLGPDSPGPPSERGTAGCAARSGPAQTRTTARRESLASRGAPRPQVQRAHSRSRRGTGRRPRAGRAGS